MEVLRVEARRPLPPRSCARAASAGRSSSRRGDACGATSRPPGRTPAGRRPPCRRRRSSPRRDACASGSTGRACPPPTAPSRCSSSTGSRRSASLRDAAASSVSIAMHGARVRRRARAVVAEQSEHAADVGDVLAAEHLRAVVGVVVVVAVGQSEPALGSSPPSRCPSRGGRSCSAASPAAPSLTHPEAGAEHDRVGGHRARAVLASIVASRASAPAMIASPITREGLGHASLRHQRARPDGRDGHAEHGRDEQDAGVGGRSALGGLEEHRHEHRHGEQGARWPGTGRRTRTRIRASAAGAAAARGRPRAARCRRSRSVRRRRPRPARSGPPMPTAARPPPSSHTSSRPRRTPAASRPAPRQSSGVPAPWRSGAPSRVLSTTRAASPAAG